MTGSSRGQSPHLQRDKSEEKEKKGGGRGKNEEEGKKGNGEKEWREGDHAHTCKLDAGKREGEEKK